MDISELRKQIDFIDDQMVALFLQRMEVSAKIADFKQKNGLPILVPAREQEKRNDLAQKAGPEMADYICSLYETIFRLSREYQNEVMG
jgi:chorismate mutase/prephenate dehydratase